MLPTRDFRYKDISKWRDENRYLCKWKQKEAGVAILVSDKTDLEDKGCGKTDKGVTM